MKVKKIISLSILPLFMMGCFDSNNSDNNTNISTTTSSIQNTNNEHQNKCDLSIKVTNSWIQDNINYYQLDINIKNNDNSDIVDWILNSIVPQDSTINQSWNCKPSINNTTLEIKSEQYNNTISPNQSINCGLILCTKESYNPKELTLKSNTLSSNETTNQPEKEESTNNQIQDNTTNSTDDKGTVINNITKLKVKDTNIVDANNNKVILRGISLHGINWFPQYVNKDTFASLKSEFNVNAVRLPLYTAEYNGYCSGGDEASLLKLVENGIDYATKENMYIIVDWHILSDSDPNKNIEKAKDFFKTISSKYKNNTNILYEICNEPNGGTTWNDITNYANEIIPIIRENTDSIIIVGTPTWSQDVDIASNNPLRKYNNITYALHFYSGTHKDNLRQKAQQAIDNKLPIIISEFGICEASGSGNIDINEANKWMNFIKENNLSYFIWNLSNKDEKSSLLNPSCTKISEWNSSELSESGKWFKNN